jgi:molecular chaperone GrpE
MFKQETQAEQPEGFAKGAETQIEENAPEIPVDGQIDGDISQSAQVASDPGTPEQQIAELETRLAETHDQLLRKAADFENFRKRINQEKASAIEYANQSLLLDIIPIIDDFERAIQAGESSLQTDTPQTGTADYKGFLEGIKMIERRFISQLETKWGLKRFNSAGELFDPNLHEALAMEKSPEITEATVQEDFIKGYMLKERVIRAAKVKVLMPEAESK